MLKITQENYDEYKKVFEILWQFQAQLFQMDPNVEYSPVNVLSSWEKQNMSMARRGLKEGLRDTMTMILQLPIETRAIINQTLISEGLPGLQKITSEIKDIPNKVLKRGKIKNLDEYYVVKEILDDTDSNISKGDITKLNNLFFEFEKNYSETKNGK